MAIQDNTQSPKGQAQQGSAAQPQAQQSTGPAPTPPHARGITGFNDRFNRTGRVEGSDQRSTTALTKMREVADAAIAHQDLQDDFHLFRFDRDAHQVGMAALLIVKLSKDAQGKEVIVVRPLVLENDAIRLKPKTVLVQNGMTTENIEIKPQAQDVFTNQYWTKITEYLRTATGHKTASVRLAGAKAVESEFDFNDATLVRNLLVTSVNRCEDVLARLNNEAPFTLAEDLKAQDEQLTARIDFTGTPVHDTTGNPIRSDIVVSMNRTKKNAGQVENEYYDADSNFNQVAAYVQLEYSPQPVTQQFYGQPAGPTPPPFIPAIVITDVRQAPWIMANTTEMFLYALSNAFRVTVNQAWAKSLLPSVGVAKDPRDIGALGLLTQAQAKLETKSDTFTDADFAALLYQLVNPNPIFMIDLNRMGDNSAIEGMFLDAQGGPNQVQATAAIIKACHNLYGRENFTQFFDHTKEAIITPYGAELQTGYYLDAHGEKQDIRALDNLAVLNFCEGNIQEFMSFYATLCNRAVPMELRLKQAENFHRMYLGQVTYTGRVTRSVFNPKFIQAMDSAGVACGVNVAMDNLTSVFGGQRFTGNTNLGGFAVTGTAQVAAGPGSTGTYAGQVGGVTGMQY